VSSYPWSVLGIEPTSDEGAIQRAYARMLKRTRPDEDPEGFTRLVAARKFALELRAGGGVGEARNKPVVSTSTAGPATGISWDLPSSFAHETGTWREAGSRTSPPPQSRFEASRQSSSGGEPQSSPRANQVDAEALDRSFSAAMNRLRGLLAGMDGANPGPNWDGPGWRTALAGMSEFSLTERGALREFIIRQALPLLPEVRSVKVNTAEERQDRGPASVADIWEREFSISQNQAELAQFCGVPAMLNYLAWVAKKQNLPDKFAKRLRSRLGVLAPVVLMPLFVLMAVIAVMQLNAAVVKDHRPPADIRQEIVTSCSAANVEFKADRGANEAKQSPDDTRRNGDAELARGDWRHAAELFSRLVALDPRDIDARIRRASAYTGMGCPDLALADYAVVKRICITVPHSSQQEERCRAVADWATVLGKNWTGAKGR